MRNTITLATLLVTVTGLCAPDARATEDPCSSYLPGGYESDKIFPEEGAVDVPTNTLIWLGMAHTKYRPDVYDEDFELYLTTDAEEGVGEVIIADFASRPFFQVSHEGYTVVRPVDPLLPQSTYRVRVDDEVVLGFTTGDGPDETPPALPQVGAGDVAAGRYASIFDCARSARVPLGIESEGPIRVLETATMQVTGPESFGGELKRITTEQRVEHSLPRAAGELTIYAGAFDIAGNFSGWTEGTTVTVPEPTCACAAVPERGLPTALALIGGLTLLGARASCAGSRRRRR